MNVFLRIPQLKGENLYNPSNKFIATPEQFCSISGRMNVALLDSRLDEIRQKTCSFHMNTSDKIKYDIYHL